MLIEGRSDCITNATQEELYLKIQFLSKLKTPVILGLEKATWQTKAFFTVTQK